MAKENINDNTKLTIGKVLSEKALYHKIYAIRGRKVMLDYDLAEIYGYETKVFNRQVRRNSKKFEGEDFMFRLTRNEVDELVRCHFGTSRDKNLFSGQDGGSRYLPYAFTEQGIYMLMTVLHGELAIRQSRALVMAFKVMKDYVTENRILLDQREQLKMMTLVAENNQSIGRIEKEIVLMDNRLAAIEEKVKNTVMKTEISPIVLDFNNMVEEQEYLLMEGELAKAVETYQKIYSRARKNIYIVDDYIDIKTLRLLGKVKKDVKITVFSDNVKHYLHKSDYKDFKKEYPGVEIKFVVTDGSMHDRFIILDYGTENESIYHCGASAKDAGKAVTMISEIQTNVAKKSLKMVIELLKKNSELKLK